MGGFLKGMAAGLASFALGFAVLSVVLEPQLPSRPPAASLPPAPEPGAVVARDLHDEVADAQPLPAGEGEEAARPDPAPEPRAAASPDASVSGVVPEDSGDHEEVNEAQAQTSDAVAPESRDTVAGADAPSEADDVPAAVAGEEMVPEEQVAEAEAGAEETGVGPAPLEDDLSGAEDAAEAPPAPEVEPARDVVAGPPGAGDEPAGPASPAVPVPSVPDGIATAPPDTTAPAEELAEDPAGPGEDGPALPREPAVLRAVPPSPGLDRVIEGVTTGRLPSIAADATEEAAESPGRAPEGEMPAATGAGNGAADLPARERHAAAHEPAAGPLFAILLLDMPADPAAEAAITALPMPVGVVLDPHDPDAPRRAQAYRAAGHEVVILAGGLPQGATPSDLDVTFDAWFRALPEAVAVIDAAERGFQGDRALAQAIMPFLAADGHGLITHERGLNPAQQSANSAGVANATVFRIIDGGDENQFTIRRYLDRATFRAQQEGRVVVMGRAAHPDTIDGLIGWRMEGRAGQVAMVPVSAVLRLP